MAKISKIFEQVNHLQTNHSSWLCQITKEFSGRASCFPFVGPTILCSSIGPAGDPPISEEVTCNQKVNHKAHLGTPG